MSKVSIVIPTYNHWELTHRLLFDIYKNCTQPFEVVVINNGSTDLECATGLEWWINSGMLPIREYKIEDNIGFLLSSNAGMRDTKGDIIALISNDVRIKNDIVTRIDLQINTTYNSFIGGKLLDFSTGWNKFGDRIFPYLEGWLLAARKVSWEEFGYFDERYVPNDFEDVDISTTAINLGYMLVTLPEESTYHAGAQTLGYNPEREALTKRNKEKFRKKWKLP